jgi:hypothetical protein
MWIKNHELDILQPSKQVKIKEYSRVDTKKSAQKRTSYWLWKSPK